MGRPLDKNALLAARSAFENVGRAATPRGLDREIDASYGIQLADAWLLSDDTDPLYEGFRCGVGAIAGQRTGVQLFSSRGFRIHACLGQGVAFVLQTPTAPYALAGGAPSLERGFNPKGGQAQLHEVQVTAGAAVFAGNPGFRMIANVLWQPERPIWIPGGQALFICAQADNTALDIYAIFSQPPLPS